MVVAFWLTYDKIQVLKNPNYRPICDINPILSCGDIMNTKQSNLLGVPNPIFGLVGFSMLLTFGIVLASGAKLKKWLWQVINLGALAGFCFFVYLFSQAVFVIHAICPFCFVIWMITPPILWYTTIYNLKEKNINPKFLKTKTKDWIFKHQHEILICWYIIVFLTLLTKFWYYWKTLV
jgi:uncharacterized membrane protein